MKGQRRFRLRYPFLPFIGVAAVLLFGLVVMLLWNAILPGLLNVNSLGYWQAIGILVLSRLLFGGFPGGGRRGFARRHYPGGPDWRQKWTEMTDEERVKFREEWKKRSGEVSEDPS